MAPLRKNRFLCLRLAAYWPLQTEHLCFLGQVLDSIKHFLPNFEDACSNVLLLLNNFLQQHMHRQHVRAAQQCSSQSPLSTGLFVPFICFIIVH